MPTWWCYWVGTENFLLKKYPTIHQLLHTWLFLPVVMLIICQPDRQQHTGAELQEALMKLLGHKIEPMEGKNA